MCKSTGGRGGRLAAGQADLCDPAKNMGEGAFRWSCGSGCRRWERGFLRGPIPPTVRADVGRSTAIFGGAAGMFQQGGGVSACFRGGQGDYRQPCGRASLALPPGPLFCPPRRQASAPAEGERPGQTRHRQATPFAGEGERAEGRGLRAEGKRGNGRKKERGARPAPLSRANRSIFPACPCRPCTSAAAGGWPRCRLPGGCSPGRR